MWLLHSYFKDSFSTWWRDFWRDGWEGHKFMRKLQLVKSKLKEWNKEKKKSILNDIASTDAIEQGYLMRMNLQDIYQERELVLVVIKVRLILLGIKLGLIFVGIN